MIFSVYDYIVSVLAFIRLMFTFRFDRFRPRHFDPYRDMLVLEGKVALVTGGNAGIGYSTVKHLARQGAKVYIASRNKSKTARAIAQFEAESNGRYFGQVKFIKLDLIDPESVVKAAEYLLDKESRLDILVNNASLLVQELPQYHSGISDYMLINHISPFLFTQKLLPIMKETSQLPDSDVRIINVSSDGHFKAPADIRFRNVQDFNATYTDEPVPFYVRYCVSKLANVLFTKELQRRLDLQRIPITVMALHPGNVNTFADVTPFPRLAWYIMWLLFMHPDVGAYTTAFAAASPIVKANPKYKGGYLQPVAQLGEASESALDVDLGKELWKTTEIIVSSFKL